MNKEILEITPSGGIYCLVSLSPSRKFDCARPNGYAISDLLNQIRLNEDSHDGFLTDGDALRWALSLLCETPIGRSLAHDARFDDWMILVEDGDEWSESASADHRLKCIHIPRYAESITVFSREQSAQMQFVFNLLKALRLIWQENTDIKRSEDLTAEDQLLLKRLIEADGDLCGLMAAYQLRSQGDHDLWRYLLSNELSHLAITLAECLDFDATTDGILDSLGFVFSDWFGDDARINRIDHAALSELDERGLKPFGAEKITFEDLIQLTQLPDGFSYLEYTAAEILTDEFYARIPDDTNRAHLMQILKETQSNIIEDIGFRDVELAKKFFPLSTFETVV